MIPAKKGINWVWWFVKVGSVVLYTLSQIWHVVDNRFRVLTKLDPKPDNHSNLVFLQRSHEICGYMRTTNSLPWELEVKALKITIPVSVLKRQLPDPDVSRGCFPRELRFFGGQRRMSGKLSKIFSIHVLWPFVIGPMVPIGCRSFSVSSAVPSPELTIGLGVEFLVFYNLCGGRHLLRTDSDETIIRKSCDKHRDLPKPSRMNKEWVTNSFYSMSDCVRLRFLIWHFRIRIWTIRFDLADTSDDTANRGRTKVRISQFEWRPRSWVAVKWTRRTAPAVRRTHPSFLLL